MDRVKHTAAQFGRSAAETIDRNLDSAAGALERSASALRSKTTSSGGRVGELAQTAAGKMDATARYFRENHTKDMVSGAERCIRDNPGVSLAAAAAVGFLIGMTMRRDHRS
jgi:ElaB/YqjD/DUF883 family membrane-anchored ribosome-binding protein